MDSRFTTLDIAQALVRRSNIPYAEAASFVRQFFDTIQEALLHEKIVKVRSLGTFKLVSVEPRESVSVADGSRIQIAGHTKISFTPDPVLRDAVNKPFAEFSTVILSDNLNLSDFDSVDAASEQEDLHLTEMSAAGGSNMADVISAESVEETNPDDELPEEDFPAEASPEEAALVAVEPHPDEAPVDGTEDEPQPEVADDARSRKDEQLQESSQKDGTHSEVLLQEDESDNTSPGSEPMTEGPHVEEDPVDAFPLAQVPTAVPAHPHYGFWHAFFAFLLGVLLFAAGYSVGYLRPFALPCLPEADKPAAAPQPAVPASPSPVAPPPPAAAPTPVQPPSPSDSVALSVVPADTSATVSLDSVPSEILAYPQLEEGEYWIVGIKGTEVMRPGRTLLNFSLKYYRSKDFVPYICIMNGIENPDVVPLNKEISIPQLRKKTSTRLKKRTVNF